MDYSYEIVPRPTELGGGWRLRLLEDGEEVGGGVFPAIDEFDDAKEALQAAYEDAEWEGYAWLDSKGATEIDSQRDERPARQAAVDFALANVRLSGFTPSEEVRHHMQRFIDGEIKFDEVLKGVLDDAQRRIDGC